MRKSKTAKKPRVAKKPRAMRRPRTIKIGRNSFLFFRNNFGEVVVCVRVAHESDRVALVGVAFCNPADLNLRRDIRVMKGHGLAVKRARQAPHVAGSFCIQLEDTAGNIGEEKLSDVITELVIKNLRRKRVDAEPFGFPRYRGMGVGEFMEWVTPFCKELPQCTE